MRQVFIIFKKQGETSKRKMDITRCTSHGPDINTNLNKSTTKDLGRMRKILVCSGLEEWVFKVSLSEYTLRLCSSYKNRVKIFQLLISIISNF